MSCCSGGESGQSSNTQIDPQLKQDALDWYANQQKLQGATQAATLNSDGTLKTVDPYSGELTAGLTDTQRNAINSYITGSNQPYDELGADQAVKAGNYAPSSVVGAQATAANATSGTIPQTDLSAYLNPYTKDVTNSTINDFLHASDLVGQNAQQAATKMGAFGGSGQGVFQANNQDNLNRTLASTLSGLNQNNFATALDTATNDLNRSADTSKFNAGADNTISLANQASTNAGNLANQAAGLTQNGQRLASASTLGGLGTDLLNGMQTDAETKFGMGTQQQNTNQATDTANYNNNYVMPNFTVPQYMAGLFNSGQGNAPQLASNSFSNGQSAQGSCC